MMTLPQIRAHLRDRRIDKVSQGTGLHYNTVREIRDNPEVDPKLSTLEKLSEYLGRAGEV